MNCRNNRPGGDPDEDGSRAGSPHDAAQSLGQRLSQVTQRVRLLVAHLAGPSVRRRVELDDLVQEVFLRALARPAALPPPEPGEAPLGRYLARIARNTVVDCVRAVRASKRDGSALALSDWSRGGVHASRIPARQAGPATELQGRESEDRLVAAFATLAADHRRVLGLRQFEGLSAAEAGLRMGRSETSIHSLYRRALEAWAEAAG